MKKGFTLIEILVVVAIIGILSTLVVVNVVHAQQKSKIARARLDIDSIHNAIVLLENDTHKWPGSRGGGNPDVNTGGYTPKTWNDDEVDLSDPSDEIGLTSNFIPSNGSWAGPYLQPVPRDPWGEVYILDYDFIDRPDMSSCSGLSANAITIQSGGPDKTAEYPCDPEGNDDIYLTIWNF